MNSGLTIFDFLQIINNKIIKLNALQNDQFNLFYSLLVDWNSKINLISRNEKNIIDRHFLNSACLARFVKFRAQDRILDIGSGGGFPAIILKILFPESSFVLIESIRKKSDFLKHTIKELDLKRIEVINDRAEKISAKKIFHCSFDYVTARAVSQLNDLVALSQPFLKKDGRMLFLKGKSYMNEIAAASFSSDRTQVIQLNSVSENQDGVLLVISTAQEFIT